MACSADGKRATAGEGHFLGAKAAKGQGGEREDQDAAEEESKEDGHVRPCAAFARGIQHERAVQVVDVDAREEVALREEPVHGAHSAHGGEQRQRVPVWELQPERRALGAGETGDAERFAGGGETEELGGEKHASEDGVVEEGEESYEELGRVGKQGVCEDGSKTGAEDVGGARVTEADRPPEGEFGRRVSIK